VRQAEQNYATYAVTYNSPPYGLMIRAGLWVELEVIIAFVLGLGFGSLMGQRMVPILLMIVYQIIFRPILLSTKILHLINLQRPLVIELAVAHFEPSGVGYQLRDRERTRRASRLVVLGAGVDCHRGRSDRGLAGGVDGSWARGGWRPGTREKRLARLRCEFGDHVSVGYRARCSRHVSHHCLREREPARLAPSDRSLAVPERLFNRRSRIRPLR
jgi:hypothetical protein